MKKKITAYATIAGNIKRESGFLYHFLNRERSILLLSFKRGNLLLRILFNARAFYIQGVILIYREAMRFPGNRGGACMVFCEAKEAPPALSKFYRWIKLAAGKTYC